jgi:hypothetical protein
MSHLLVGIGGLKDIAAGSSTATGDGDQGTSDILVDVGCEPSRKAWVLTPGQLQGD